MVKPVKMPRSKMGLKRPADKRHALLQIEKENVWITSRDRKLAETFCTLVTQGDPLTVVKTAGITIWGTYAGESDRDARIVLDRKPDGRFRLVPLDITCNRLLEQVAHFVGRQGSITSQAGKHGRIFHGEFRNPNKSLETEVTVQESQSEVALAPEKPVAETVKIPKSREKLKRPADKRHALLRIEKENVWVTGRNRELAESFCTLVTQGDPVTVAKSTGITTWGTYAGEPDHYGTIILDRKPDGRFKLVPMGITPNALLEQVAYRVGRDGSVTSAEGKHGLNFRGEFRNPNESIEAKATDQESEPEIDPAAKAPTDEFEKIIGEDAIAAIKQKVTLEFFDHGAKIRIRGKQAECEKTAKQVIKGTPNVASQQGSKYMIEGIISKSFLRKGANQQGPDANGVCTRENSLERTITAFGENLPAVQAACLAGCKQDTMFTIVVNNRSAGYVVICSGKRRML